MPQCVGIFITGFKLNNVTKYDQRLFYAVNYGWGEVLTSGRDHGPVETHQGQGQAAEKLAGHLAFLHPLAPRQCSRQLSHLGNSTRVKSAKSFNREGQEDDALKAASFCRVLDFPLVGHAESSFKIFQQLVSAVKALNSL